MTLTQDAVLERLRKVPFPGFQRDIVSFGTVRGVAVEPGGVVRVRLALGPGNAAVAGPLRAAVAEAMEDLPGVSKVDVRLEVAGGGPAPGGGEPESGPAIPDVGHLLAVASGKGGVGKSTVAVNLAVALARSGLRAGLLDADIYGPSIPIMMGVREQPKLDPSGRRILPFHRHGVRFMSLGFLVDPETAVIWRGPMVMKAVDQLLHDVAWGPLDVLVVDLPPGTGDAQLTLAQRARLSGSVIVTTPQDVALADAVKAVNMFRKVGVPVLGLVENMSRFLCPHCGGASEIFGHGGGRRAAERLGIPFLAEIPLEPALRESGDRGEPLAAAGGGPAAEAFETLARSVADALRKETAGDRS